MEACKFNFICNLRWAELETTELSGIKFCANCQKCVHLVTNPTEFSLANSLGRCAAVIDENVGLVKIGEPGSNMDWPKSSALKISLIKGQSLTESQRQLIKVLFPNAMQEINGIVQLLNGQRISLGRLSTAESNELKREISKLNLPLNIHEK